MGTSSAAADRVVAAVHAQAVSVVSMEDARGRETLRRLVSNLRAADHRLTHRLRLIGAATGGPEATFSGAQASAYRTQIRQVTHEVEAMLRGETGESSRHAMRRQLQHTTTTLARLEEAFSGVVTPLRLREASVQLGLVEGTMSSLLRRHASAARSYSAQQIGVMERVLGEAMLDGLSQAETVERLMSTGSFGSQTWRAWRVVRTETAYAYAESRTQALASMAEEIVDLRRVLVETFDNRTAWDSVLAHGQVRRIGEFFVDGAGREYYDPPGRPNDRAVTLPWRERWGPTEHTRPLSESERESWRRRIAARPAARRRSPRAA